MSPSNVTMHGAGAFGVEQLVDEQRAAFTKAVEILASLVDNVDRDAREPNDANAPYHSADLLARRFGQARPSQVVLFDAGRGAGKSSLLYTLCNEAAAAFRTTALVTTPSAPGRRDAASTGRGLSDFERSTLSRFLPLHLVDIQPLPRGRPLIAYLLLALAELRRTIGGASDSHGSAPWLTSQRAEPLRRLEESWHQLILAVNAFDQVTPPLPGDALIAAKDLLDHAEAAGTLNYRFERFVTGLVEVVQSTMRVAQPPLLLVPIDDADMNAELSHQCIELLRTLFHKQVVFVITGHSELFLTRLQDHALRSFERLDDESRRQQARRSAFELYDRVIPPARRCAVEPLPYPKRLEMRVEHYGRGESIAEVLRWPGETQTFKSGLNTLLLDEVDPPGDEPTAPRKIRVRRRASALPDRLRALLNLREKLEEVRADFLGRPQTPENVGEYAIRQALLIWESATEFRFTSSEQSRLDEVTRWVYPERAERSELNLDVIKWRVTHRPLGHTGDRRSPTLRLFLSRIDGASIEMPDKRLVPLDDRQCAALTLVASAVEEHRPNSALYRDMPFARERPGFVVAVVRTIDGKEHSLPWPVPEWKSVEPASRFATRWEILARSGALRDEAAVFRWYVALIVLASFPWQLSKRGRWSSEKHLEPLGPLVRWQSLFDGNTAQHPSLFAHGPTDEEFVEVFRWMASDAYEKHSARSDVAACFEWMRSRLPLLLTPECGLPTEIVEAILERGAAKGTELLSTRGVEVIRFFGESPGNSLGAVLSRYATKIKDFRRLWLAEFELTTERFDDRGHPWGLLNASFASTSEFNSVEVLDSLRRVAIRPAPGVPRSAQTLDWLIGDHVSEDIFEELPREAQRRLRRFLELVVDAGWDNEGVLRALSDVTIEAARELSVQLDRGEAGIELVGNEQRRALFPRFSVPMETRRPLARGDTGSHAATGLAWCLRSDDDRPINYALDVLVCLCADLRLFALNQIPIVPESATPMRWLGWRRKNDVRGQSVFAWLPSPKYPAPGELFDASSYWNSIVSRIKSPSSAGRFVLRAVLRTDALTMKRPFDKRLVSWTDYIGEFFSPHVAQSFDDPENKRARALRLFRDAIPLFASPEQGLPEDEATEILDACRAHGLRFSTALNQTRASLLRFEGDRRVENSVIDAIDQGSGASAWLAFVNASRAS